jgi:hypothetical protein
MEKTNNQRLKKELRKFGISFSLGMLILFFIGFKHFNIYVKVFILATGVFHIIFAFVNPLVLKPSFYIISKAGFFLGDIITKLFLTLFFYLIFSPIAFILRMAGRDEIARNSKCPQWKDIDPAENDPKRVEKLY